MAPAQGGPRGMRYEVELSSVPKEATDEDDNSAPLALPAPATGTALAVQNQTPISLPALSASTLAATREWEWCLEIIRPALAFPKGSTARAEMIRQLASTPILAPDGDRCQVAARTIRGWLKDYDERLIAGLCRKPRSDRGARRVVISKAWDEGVSLSDEVKADIAAKLRRYARSLWAEGVAGWRNCARLATAKLVKLTRAAGSELTDARLLALCEVPRPFVEAERNYSLIALKDKDAKGFADTMLPRTRRTRDGMAPMSLVVADVHHLDILFRRPEDGSLCTPKIIAWSDIATNRLFATVVFLAPGEGVRQEHVIGSFIDMTQHPDWGMPQALYLDNGGEFSKLGFVDDAMKLAALAQCQGFRIGVVSDDVEVSALVKRASSARRKMVIHAKPYNASAKPIEGIFGILEGGALSMVPGWIGGERMKAKTHNVGREPLPFPGTDAEFASDIQTALDFYHTNSQSGSLKGKSPREAFATAVTAGWKRIDVDRMALQAVFAKDIWRIVTQGEFTIDSTLYRADKLLSLLAGTKVRVRIPLVGDKARVAVFADDGEFLGIAEPAPLYGFLDRAGAKNRGKRTSVQTKAITVMRRDTDAIDLVAEMRGAAALQPLAPAPESGGMIRLSDEHEAIAQETRRFPASQSETQDRKKRDRLAQADALSRLAASA